MVCIPICNLERRNVDGKGSRPSFASTGSEHAPLDLEWQTFHSREVLDGILYFPIDMVVRACFGVESPYMDKFKQQRKRTSLQSILPQRKQTSGKMIHFEKAMPMLQFPPLSSKDSNKTSKGKDSSSSSSSNYARCLGRRRANLSSSPLPETAS